MRTVTMKELLEAGVHFGHQSRRWNPKMAPYIFAERNGIYIIDLQKTLRQLQTAYEFVQDVAARGGAVLFVGTKKQTQETVADEAARCQMFHVNHRWLGGMLTNYETIRRSISRLTEIEEEEATGGFERRPKKEVMRLRREKTKLDNNLAGIKTMGKLPEAVIITDTRKEHIAVKEANKLGVPVVAIVDTNCDPDPIDYPIPANDDAIRAIKLICSVLATAVIEGRASALEGADDAESPVEEASEPEASESETVTDEDDVENQESKGSQEDSQEEGQVSSQEESQEDSQEGDQEDNS
ncbi:30S ribosomal protein S2 [Candidatus Poribacteria bacterium]|nr:30S ribosomal protein S2 [Candidatus Poribacteria bacterium]